MRKTLRRPLRHWYQGWIHLYVVSGARIKPLVPGALPELINMSLLKQRNVIFTTILYRLSAVFVSVLVNITFQVQRFYWYYYLYTGYGIFEAGLETAYYDSYECYKGRYSPALPNLNPRSKHYLCLLQLVKTQYPGTRQSGTTGGRLCSWNGTKLPTAGVGS